MDESNKLPDESSNPPDKNSKLPENSEGGSDLKRALFTVSDAVLGAAVLLALGVYGGAWLDKQFHCSPTLSIGLALLGGGLGLARMVMKANALDTGKDKKLLGSAPAKRSASARDIEGVSDASSEGNSVGSQTKIVETKEVPKDGKVYDTSKQRLPFEDFD